MNHDPSISKEMRARYLERRSSDLEILTQDLMSLNFESFKRIGHQLKGNAASFGYNDLEKICIELESAGLNSDAEKSRQCLILFRAWLRFQQGIAQE